MRRHDLSAPCRLRRLITRFRHAGLQYALFVCDVVAVAGARVRRAPASCARRDDRGSQRVPDLPE